MSGFHLQVDRFLADINVQSVRDLSRESRPLKICYPQEVPVSRFLIWLLDPTQGHGLQDSVIRAAFMAAWEVSGNYEVHLEVRNFLRPAAIEANSYDDCLVEREVHMDGDRLDVLVLDPKKKWLLAIEHKFGAKEGANQLKRYKKWLAREFKGWTQVLVFLDYDEKSPSVEGWIGLNYEWLIRELKTAEKSPWIAEGCKSVLRDFREAVDWEAREFVHIAEDLLHKMVVDHRAIFEQMSLWESEREHLGSVAKSIFGTSKTLGDRAMQQLFKVYWQRRALWGLCIPMLAFAPLLVAARKAFPDVRYWVARKCMYFRLESWSTLDDASDEDNDDWALAVRVRPLANEKRFGSDQFGVLSYCAPCRFAPEMDIHKKAKVIEAYRSEAMKKHDLDLISDFYSLKADWPVPRANAHKTLVDHLRGLDELHLRLI